MANKNRKKTRELTMIESLLAAIVIIVILAAILW